MKTGKRKLSPTAWKKGQSGNPKGRPKDGESWAAIIKAVGEMYPNDILAFVGTNNDLGKVIAQLPKNVQMKYLVTARVFSALMFEPTAGLWKELMERADGKVGDKLDLTNSDGSLTKMTDEEKLARLLVLAKKANESE
jgi:hypothetical protein